MDNYSIYLSELSTGRCSIYSHELHLLSPSVTYQVTPALRYRLSGERLYGTLLTIGAEAKPLADDRCITSEQRDTGRYPWRFIFMRIQNPIMWSDYPDPDIIRTGDIYYMVSTTMFFMPGGPILKSRDLVHWEIVSYIFDTLEGYDAVGTGYGHGQWATSLREHNGRFYAFFTCLDLHKSFMYSTDNIEKSNWDCIVFDGVYHDASLLFDDRNAYLIYERGGTGAVRIAELEPNLSGFRAGTDRPLLETPSEGMALRCEGCRAIFKDGWYYLFFIDIPQGGLRREWCYRARSVNGPYEARLIADSRCGLNNIGVAQGTVVSSPEGNWYMILFGDFGAVGRIPFLFPVSWEDDWPVIGAGEGMQLSYNVPLKSSGKNILVHSDTFNHTENRLALFWQWNHNPNNKKWSFTERPGWLRLVSSPASGLMDAVNTLSQRACGPGCAFTVEIDGSSLKPGGRAGLAALQWDCALTGVECDANGFFRLFTAKRTIEKQEAGRTETPGVEHNVFTAALPSAHVFLKAVFDFRDVPDTHDTVQFFYSADGLSWSQAGPLQKLSYDLRYFVGTRVALYCYGTGFADFCNFTAEVL